eukprot:TRINITY_DN6784_c0_g1_i1.p1 TRINITY_DN6784_c0_g1~~TRINITY_DN6784_c0_g1_i1.p1  ORF type:complete len:307 (+),score=40.26 TRINITY_DN6784_c0_g1_i1:86-922(+)
MGGDGGDDIEVFLMVFFLVMLVLAVVYCAVSSERGAAPSMDSFVGVDQRSAHRPGGDALTAAPLPTGSWRGYYHQYGQRWNVSTFELAFDEDRRTVRGSGTDSIGRYSVAGKVSSDGRKLAFQKMYVPNSLADNGRVNRTENKGHMVSYRGVSRSGLLGQGYKGTWYINVPGGYSGKGAFHIWPAMQGWQNQQTEITRFQVAADNVCVICFSNPINACIAPCGHIAACHACLSRMRAAISSPGCPICRTPIESVLDANGVEMARPDITRSQNAVAAAA